MYSLVYRQQEAQPTSSAIKTQRKKCNCCKKNAGTQCQVSAGPSGIARESLLQNTPKDGDLTKYMSIGVGKRILKCFQIPIELTVRSSCCTISGTIHALCHVTCWLLYNRQTPLYGYYWRSSQRALTPCRALQLLLPHTRSAEQSGSTGAWCRGGFRQARWVRMYGNSPVTVQLDAQVPWRVAHDSEPSMLAPVGAPAATFSHSLQSRQSLTHACLFRKCRGKHDKHCVWQSSVGNQ